MFFFCRKYEELAILVANKCYTQNKDRCRQLLVRKLTNWGEATAFALAESANAMVG
jgi:hypothetical protein